MKGSRPPRPGTPISPSECNGGCHVGSPTPIRNIPCSRSSNTLLIAQTQRLRLNARRAHEVREKERALREFDIKRMENLEEFLVPSEDFNEDSGQENLSFRPELRLIAIHLGERKDGSRV
jgi:hypothetical protein